MFRKTDISYPLVRGVRSVSFTEKFAYTKRMTPLYHCLIFFTDKLTWKTIESSPAKNLVFLVSS